MNCKICSEELLIKPRNCPFCDTEPEIAHYSNSDKFCIECVCPDCDIRPCTSLWETREEAIDKWNGKNENSA